MVPTSSEVLWHQLLSHKGLVFLEKDTWLQQSVQAISCFLSQQLSVIQTMQTALCKRICGWSNPTIWFLLVDFSESGPRRSNNRTLQESLWWSLKCNTLVRSNGFHEFWSTKLSVIQTILLTVFDKQRLWRF